uniref:Uncharacterized protein n=1 Tax=Anguilla anguilla TaxID=7936 RepID=A0A0E9RGL3_ANGAN
MQYSESYPRANSPLENNCSFGDARNSCHMISTLLSDAFA